MVLQQASPQPLRRGLVPLACTLTACLLIAGTEAGGQQKGSVLRIGTSGTLSTKSDPAKEKAALDSLQAFVKEETGLRIGTSEVIGQRVHPKTGRTMIKPLVYSLTAAGRRQLADERETWHRFSGALAAILRTS